MVRPILKGHEPAIWAAAFVDMMTETIRADGPESLDRPEAASYAAAWAAQMVKCARLAIEDALPQDSAAMLREMLGKDSLPRVQWHAVFAAAVDPNDSGQRLDDVIAFLVKAGSLVQEGAKFRFPYTDDVPVARKTLQNQLTEVRNGSR